MSEAEAAPSGASEYEFSAAHNQIVTSLSGAIVLVSVGTILMSSILIMFGLVHVASNGLTATFLTLGGVTGLVIGFWLMKAASALDDVVKTKGKDVSHLMQGLSSMRNVFAVQALLLTVQASILLLVTIISLRH